MNQRLEPLSADIVNEKLDKHEMWRNAYAQLWDGWQLDVSNFDCSGYRFSEYSLVEMVGSFALMRNCQFLNCDITYGRFNSSILENSFFSRCKMTKAYLPCARLAGSVFQDCDICNADFRMAKMNNVRMECCTLQGCDFMDAELNGADFRLCDVSECNFIGTALDFSKKKPEYCYCTDNLGNTVMLITGYNAVYDLPLFMQHINPMLLNAAYGLSEDDVRRMIYRFSCGWSA